MVGAAQSSDASSTPSLNVLVGGYDGTVAGLSLTSDTDNLLALSANFAYAAHIGAVRSAAFNGPTLVTGGVDETVRIYDLAKRVERGLLFQHNGTINALRWLKDGHRDVLLSASDDASICVWRTSDWRCLKKLVAHQAGVVDVAPHPTGRLALSVAKDRSLFMWNMVKGKVAFSGKVKGKPASCVRWAPGGRRYILVSGELVSLSEVDGKDVRTFAHEKEVLCVDFLGDGRVVTGGEGKVVKIWDERSREGEVALEHERRVRDVGCVGDLLVSADSGGGLKVWDVRMGGKPRLETFVGGGGMRLTCMAVGDVERNVTVPDEGPEAEMENGETKGQDSGRKAGKKKKEENQKREVETAAPLQGTASQRKRKKRKTQKED